MHFVEPDFRMLFESSPGSYLVLAPDFTIRAVSNAYLRATSTMREDLVGRGVFEVFPDNLSDSTGDGTSSLRASIEAVLKLRVPAALAIRKEDVRKVGPRGEELEEKFWSPLNSPVFDDAGEIVYIIHRVEDVTEVVRLKQQGTEHTQVAATLRTRTGEMEAEVLQRSQDFHEANEKLVHLHEELETRVQERTDELRKSEGRLLQAQKMESIGRLAGGIAHDFNNVLSIILTLSEMLGQDTTLRKPVLDDLAEIRKAGQRAAALTGQLLAFSRQQVLETRVLDLNGIVLGMQRMLGRLIGEDVEMVSVPAQALGSVRADPTQIEQVLLNLVVNARDAMPTGGHLTIETANVDLDQAYSREHPEVTPGSYVMLAVSDSGVGIDAATQARIFEPFFTTKAAGKGTGLGLATVFGIVKQSEGHVWVYSEVGKGTTFKVYLPRTDEVASVEAVAEISSLDGHETILLVEDDPQVRSLLCALLEKLGYTVLQAGTAEEALTLNSSCETRIDLLLTDVVMPQMSGTALAKRLSQDRAGIKILCMSGYTDEAVLRHGLLDSGLSFLQKPITPGKLGRRLRELLGPQGGSRQVPMRPSPSSIH